MPTNVPALEYRTAEAPVTACRDSLHLIFAFHGPDFLPHPDLLGTDCPFVLSAELAKKAVKPIASLISVPFQFNYDQDFGSLDGHKSTLNIQPVIPISLNEDWNLISRTILPVVWHDDMAGPSGSQFGLGDTVQSFFLSPANPTASGLVWGAGPVFLIPTATDHLLGGEKWGAVQLSLP